LTFHEALPTNAMSALSPAASLRRMPILSMTKAFPFFTKKTGSQPFTVKSMPKRPVPFQYELIFIQLHKALLLAGGTGSSKGSPPFPENRGLFLGLQRAALFIYTLRVLFLLSAAHWAG
jgi:hypothetical protein